MQTTPTTAIRAAPAPTDYLRDHPVREYVAAMARELAFMARCEGDQALGRLLDDAADVAERPSI